MDPRRRFIPTFLAICALFVSLIPPSAQASLTGPQMLGDFHTGTESSNPNSFLPFGDKMLFVANGSDAWVAPWITDGTSQGTYILKDTAPGSVSAASFGVVLNDEAYFSARSDPYGQELWKTDGTPQGTQMVADLAPGMGSGNPGGMLVNNGQIYFFATPTGSNYDTHLFRTDGSAAGTVQMGTINIQQAEMAVFDGRVYFTGSTGDDSVSLWRTTADGMGVEMVAVLVSTGFAGSFPHDFTEMAGKLFFTQTQKTSDETLWSSDGTPQGTQLIKTFHGPERPQNLAVFNGWLYFGAADGDTPCTLWRSDGSAAGTAPVAGAPVAAEFGCPKDFTNLGNDLYFNAFDAVHGNEPWKLDGTSGAITLVSDINPGAGYSYPGTFAAMDGALYFSASQAGEGDQPDLWRTQGTPETTTLVKQCRQPDYFYVNMRCSPVRVWQGKLLISGFDLHYGQEVWTSDGTPDGTHLLVDVNTYPAGSNFQGGKFFKDGLIFIAEGSDTPFQLWFSDGTPLGTTRLANVKASLTDRSSMTSSFSNPTSRALGDFFYFPASDGVQGTDLWRTDGTPGGPQLFKDLSSESQYQRINSLGSDGRYLYFSVDCYDNILPDHYELWRTDGTPPGTLKVLDQSTGLIAVVNQRVVISAVDASGTQLFHSTASGDLELFATLPAGNIISNFVAVGDQLFFTNSSRYHIAPLYRTDGETVQEIKPAGLSTPLNPIQDMAAAGDTLYISASINNAGGLWKVPPGSTTAELVSQFTGGPYRLMGIGNKVFFILVDETGGGALWVNDSSSQGPHSVCPTCEFTRIDWKTGMAAWQGLLYFTASDPLHGTELWQTDGTPAGTRLYLDARPGPESSNPNYLTAQGDKLFFTADDGIHGSEPWAVVRVLDQVVYVPLAQR
jgi:ELWxxDGT repeat protein